MRFILVWGVVGFGGTSALLSLAFDLWQRGLRMEELFSPQGREVALKSALWIPLGYLWGVEMWRYFNKRYEKAKEKLRHT